MTKRHNEVHSGEKIAGWKTAVAAGVGMLALSACETSGNSDEPLVTLTSTEAENLKNASAHKIDDLLEFYEKKDITYGKGTIHAYTESELPTEGEVSGDEMTYYNDDSVRISVEGSMDGAKLTVARTSSDYCSIEGTGEVATKKDCPYESEYIDTGYEASYVNSDVNSLDPKAPLSLKEVKAFIADEDTRLASIGDTYFDTFYIDEDGAVTTRENYYGTADDSPEEAKRVLERYAN